MSIHVIRTALAAIVCCGALSACGGSSSDDDATQPAAAPETTAGAKPAEASVRSTLEGKRVLPQRIKWLAEPTLPESEIERVDFLIDGTVRWVEREAPYGYEEGEGFLVTTWLAPGRHRFTVRVRAVDGRTASRTVRARVRPAPEVPRKLAGTWHRHVSQAEAVAADGAPSGRYRLVFERRWLQDRGPGKWDPETSNETGYGGIIDNYWIPGPKTFVVDGSVTFRPLREADAEGGWECEPSGPRARYRWSVAGDTLTLAPVGGSDPCDARGAIFTGKWKRGR
jgi:hypothetical protein